MRKAQMEIMGLAVIVILLSLGLLFVLRFMVLNEPSDLRQSYTRTQLASNLLNTILKTSTDCRGNTINELIHDCAVYPTPQQCTADKTSCYMANESIKIILNETLTKMGNRSFNFVTSLNNDIIIDPIQNGDCSGEKDTEIQPLPTVKGDIIIRLEICS